MGGDVAQHKRGAGDFRIDAPLLRLERVRAFVGIEAVGVLQFDHAYFADVAVRDHGAHLHQQWMAGEAVGYADDQAFLRRQRLDFSRLRRGEEQRLFADDMQAGIQRGARDCIVGAVRGGDGHHLNAVFAVGFLLQQLLIVVITAFGGHAEVDAKLASARRVDIKGAGNQPIGGVVAQCAGTVLVAHLAEAAAADHRPTQRAGDASFTI